MIEKSASHVDLSLYQAVMRRDSKNPHEQAIPRRREMTFKLAGLTSHAEHASDL